MATILKLEQGSSIGATVGLDISEFLLDGQLRNLSPGTLGIYRRHLEDFARWLGDRRTAEITTQDIRCYLLSLQERRNPGGQRQAFRVLFTFFRWLTDEGIIPTNPMQKLKAPRVPEKLLDPVPLETVAAMLGTCGRSLLDLRDAALLMFLVDTGARASEVTAVNVGDCDLGSGTVLLRVTKTKRPRAVFLGKRARKALLAYLRARKAHPTEPLFTTDEGERLTYWGLRQILRRRAEKAGVPAPSAHAFRRAFCLGMLRNGADVFSVQKLAGHSSLSTTQRYLKQLTEDLERAHERYSPVDRLLRR